MINNHNYNDDTINNNNDNINDNVAVIGWLLYIVAIC